MPGVLLVKLKGCGHEAYRDGCTFRGGCMCSIGWGVELTGSWSVVDLD